MQGDRQHPDLYNIATITLPPWNKNTDSVAYADDEVNLIAAVSAMWKSANA